MPDLRSSPFSNSGASSSPRPGVADQAGDFSGLTLIGRGGKPRAGTDVDVLVGRGGAGSQDGEPSSFLSLVADGGKAGGNNTGGGGGAAQGGVVNLQGQSGAAGAVGGAAPMGGGGGIGEVKVNSHLGHDGGAPGGGGGAHVNGGSGGRGLVILYY